MNNTTLEKISAELESFLSNQKFGKIFSLSRLQMAIDFRLPDSRYLFISVEPNAPRIYLIKRRLKDLERQTGNPSPFVLFLRKRLSNAVLQSIEKLEDERIISFSFVAQTEIGETENYSLIVQLTGRSANLFLLDENGFILDSLRENSGAGQEIADKYAPPFREGEKRRRGDEEIFPQGDFETLSEALDAHFLEKEVEKRFLARAKSAESKLNQEISKRKKLLKNLNRDLAAHGDAANWKRFGDLILANLATAERQGDKVLVTDFYDENLPTIEIEAGENLSLTETAEKYFKRYTKARNALEEISKRLEVVEKELADLEEKKTELDEAIAEKDEDFLTEFLGEKGEEKTGKAKQKREESFSGARRYVSTDGFEILVGKGSKDNDFLTFRVAKSLDLWLHAADYPGSHVVVRNPNRQEIPQKTLLEAAQLAAFFSQARTQPKVAVHYTQKKFINKPKGANPGLVSLASFKTILVEPKGLENV
ncbi:MAG TPA: NFACT family protein [Pyrinomonadaceae bacterium]|nr:NFACT family protein [Pyrinomonadaceae bacterium]